MVAEARTRTVVPPLRTEVTDRWQHLRGTLDAEDAFSVLQVDRDLSRDEVPRVMLGETAPDAAGLARDTARLRKRFPLRDTELRTRERTACVGESRP